MIRRILRESRAFPGGTSVANASVMLRRALVTAVFLVVMPATVEAFDHHHSHHQSSSGGGGCGSSSSSSHETTTHPSPSPTPSPAYKRVFVTSSTYSGAVGGLESADLQCQSRAGIGGYSGVFRAWLSDRTTDAYDRTADAGPWYTTGDELAFSSKTDLRGAPKSELLDEYGGYPGRPSAANAWSGTDSTGAWSGQDCDGWTNATLDATATIGSAVVSDAAWGGGDAALHCNEKAPLICFQQ